MHYGITMFCTDYAIPITEPAQAGEDTNDHMPSCA